jgi:signal transduction histidine kinase/AmiR/NasT family two-component response regulator/HPt (histidine-containing phosphotransfer) domain-containing protein
MENRVKMSIIVIVIMVIIAGGIPVIQLRNASKVALNLSRQKTMYLARQYAQYWDGKIDGYIKALQALSNVMNFYENIEPAVRRQEYERMLRAVFEDMPEIVRMFTIWKPDALDGMDARFIGRTGSTETGQFAYTLTRETGEITTTTNLVVKETMAHMTGPNSKKVEMADPAYLNLAGKDTLCLRILVPIINKRLDETVGVVGCRVNIDLIQPLVEQTIDNYEEVESMAIYTNSGFILANYLPEMIGKQLVEVETQYGEHLDQVAEAVTNARELEVDSFDPELKTTMYMSIAPIPLSVSPTTWSVMIGSTEAYILKDVNAMINFTIMLMIIVVLAAVALALVLIRVDAAKAKADAESRHKSMFLANMSHELRTPLNVVIGLTDLILEDKKLDNHTTENLVKISNAGSTLLSIVNDVLDFSKIESGKLTLSPVEYYVSSLLNDIATLTITLLGEKPITFRLDIPDDLPNKLYGDDLRVKQVLTNLLTNSAKYTQEGSIDLKMRCAREADTVWMDIAVKDTGIGISKENIKSLFSNYYQVDEKANRHIEGTGLGLAITKRLVKMMEGQINVESERGKGSTFSFRLKQGYVDDSVLGADVSDKLRNFSYIDDKRITTQKLVRINLDYAKVLVVDDMQTNLDVASGLLRKYQMQVDCLTNGPAAIERIRSETPVYNAIFMDHMMPGMDGIETVDRIRALGTEYAKKIPIIALTANAIQGTDKMFYDHDFQAFISKPIDVMELDSVLRKWVRDDTRETVMVQTEPSSGEEDKKIVIEIPGVDTKKGLSLYVGDTKVYLSLLRSYITNTPNVLEKLRSVSAENLSDYVITVHGLKGTSAGIGAEAVRKQALELEDMSRAGDLQGVLAKNNKLIADVEIIVANIKEWLDKNDVHEAKPRLKAPDKKLLEKLKDYCESYDIDGIEEVMSSLENADYEEDADLVKWIREKIDISKMGEVAKRLAS